MNSARHFLLSAVVTLALAGVAQLKAATIVLGYDDLLGTIFPGTPADSVNATEQVRFLVEKYNLGIASGTALGNNAADPQAESYTLYRPVGAPTTLVAPIFDHRLDTTFNPVIDLDGTSYEYALFFQANKAWVYYIGDIAGSDSIKWGGHPFPNPAANINGNGLSHYVLFNGTPDVYVPEGGTVTWMLGASLLALAVAVRRVRR